MEMKIVHELNMVTNKVKVLDTFCEIIIRIYCQIINGRKLNMNIVHSLSSETKGMFLSNAFYVRGNKYTIKKLKDNGMTTYL